VAKHTPGQGTGQGGGSGKENGGGLHLDSILEACVERGSEEMSERNESSQTAADSRCYIAS
jgi:hypothetical protein